MNTCRIILVLSLVFAFQLSNDAAPKKKEVEEWVMQYVMPDNSETLRKVLAQKLAGAESKDMTAPLKDSLKIADQVGRSLTLAIWKRVPGLLGSVKPLIDGKQGGLAVEYIANCTDKGAADFLFVLWKDADKDSDRFGVIDKALSKCSMEFEDMDNYKKTLEDEEVSDSHKESATKYIQYQLGLDSDYTVDDILKNWRKLKKVWKTDSKKQKHDGTLLNENNGLVASGHWGRRGDNIWLCGDGKIEVKAPDEWQKKKRFTLSFYIRVYVDGINTLHGASFQLKSDSTHWLSKLCPEGWTTTGMSKGDITVEVDLEKWHKVEIVYYDDNVFIGDKLETITIDGKVLVTRGYAGSKAEKFIVEAGGCKVCIGGIGWE